MRLRLSEENREFREELRTFLHAKVPQEIRDTVARGLPISREQQIESHRILNAAGLAVPRWPIEWGGRDWTPLQHYLWNEELELAAVPAPLAFNTTMIGPVLAAFGSKELKQRFLPATANLDIWWSQGFSEPEAGSDLASLRTTAVRDGDHYVVNGQKTWATLAQHGDWIFTLVRTDPIANKQRGISMLLIDMTSPGMTVRPIELIDGGHEVNEVYFDNVRVPAENLVGEENKGWDYAKFLLGNERMMASSVAGSKRQLASAKRIAAELGQLDDAILATRFAELEDDLLALELTSIRVGGGSSNGKPHPASSVFKIRGTELQQAVTEVWVDLAGVGALASGAGEVTDVPEWARVAVPNYLNFRKTSIYGGSNEVQRQIIASTILGLRG